MIKKLAVIFMTLGLFFSVSFCTYAGTQSVQSVAVTFDFSIYVNSDNDNWTSEDYVYRDVSILGASPAHVQFSTLSNAANSLNIRVNKWNPYSNTFSAKAGASKMIRQNSSHSVDLPYYSAYNEASGAYKLYAWTTRNDCRAYGHWTP